MLAHLAGRVFLVPPQWCEEHLSDGIVVEVLPSRDCGQTVTLATQRIVRAERKTRESTNSLQQSREWRLVRTSRAGEEPAGEQRAGQQPRREPTVHPAVEVLVLFLRSCSVRTAVSKAVRSAVVLHLIFYARSCSRARCVLTGVDPEGDPPVGDRQEGVCGYKEEDVHPDAPPAHRGGERNVHRLEPLGNRFG